MSGFKFQDAVSAVQAAIRVKPGGSSSNTIAMERRSPSYTVERGSPRDSTVTSLDDFPKIDDVKLYSLIPSLGLNEQDDKEADEARRVVRLALDEMKLNWDLDPRALGNERTDFNRGCFEIARILTQVRLQVPEKGSRRREGELSGDLPEEEDGSSAVAGASSEKATKASAAKLNRAYETHDLLKAIDRKDVETIIAIRDANFDLLLDLGGASSKASTKNSTPLGYAMGLGKEWEGICIVITGALSRFVNQLPDAEEEDLEGHDATASGPSRKARTVRNQLDPRTMARLRKVRANLKLAIDSSLVLEQTSLLASYCQVLNMSEGDTFIQKSVEAVSHALHARIASGGSSIGQGSVITSADPFAVARQAVLQYVTEALRKRDRVAQVEDYVANSCGDLVLMGLWDMIRLRSSEKELFSEKEKDTLHPDIGQLLPTYFFARDDRVTSHFLERVEALKSALDLLAHRENAPKGTRHQRVWNRAQEVASALSGSTRRLSSGERLELVRSVIMR